MVLDPQATPVTETSLGVYFRERLQHYAQQLRPPPLEDTCWYLGTVLERFCRPEHLFVWQDGQLNLRPLALLYGDALQTSNARQRCAVLQQLGDMAPRNSAMVPMRQPVRITRPPGKDSVEFLPFRRESRRCAADRPLR